MFIAKKYKPLQLESIVRGYLSGSAWKSYEQSGKINGKVYEKNLKKIKNYQNLFLHHQPKRNQVKKILIFLMSHWLLYLVKN